MRIAVARTQVPFVTGGAELHSARLCQALREYGHEATEVTVPFKWYPGKTLVQSICAAKLIDLSEVEGVPVDLMIGLKFPAYLMRHPNPVFWILHQHRQAYDMWDNGTSDLVDQPEALELRQLVAEEDRRAFALSKLPVFANSVNVANRLDRHLGIKAEPLYHPPPRAERFYTDGYSNPTLFAPGRINPSKRLDLILRAFAAAAPGLRLVIAGEAENPRYLHDLQVLAKDLGIDARIDWLGRVSDEVLLQHYAMARAVVFVPRDEDYGYVTLEAMLAAKAVITTDDSGGPLEFVQDKLTGLVTTPTVKGLADAFDRLEADAGLAERLGRQGKEAYVDLDIRWERVVDKLLGANGQVAAPSSTTAESSAKDDGAPIHMEVDAVEALRKAVAPCPYEAPLFKNVAEVLEAFDFSRRPDGGGGASNPQGADERSSMADYLQTHWVRYLTTLRYITDNRPRTVLDVGVFPPFVFQGLIHAHLPEANISGLWEGPWHLHQAIAARAAGVTDFKIDLRPGNAETEAWPYDDECTDMVLAMEIFEHLAIDPDFFLREAARVLRPGGRLVLTTPNIASHRGLRKVLEQQSPYSFGLFVPGGGVYGRHNREYTPHEVAALVKAAGFEVETLITADVYDQHIDPQTATFLAQRKDDLRFRGENIQLVGRKIGPLTHIPDGFFHGNPRMIDSQLGWSWLEKETGLVRISVTNDSDRHWHTDGDRPVGIHCDWISPDGAATYDMVIALPHAVAAGYTCTVDLRLDGSSSIKREELGTLAIRLYQDGVGTFSGSGRSNEIRIPCSAAAFRRSHDLLSIRR